MAKAKDKNAPTLPTQLRITDPVTLRTICGYQAEIGDTKPTQTLARLVEQWKVLRVPETVI